MLSNNSNGQNTNNYPASSASSRDALDVNLSEYLLKVKRRWKLALATFLLTLGVAGGLSLLQRQTYQATGKILFKQKSSAVITGIGEKSSTLEPILPDQTPLSTQIQVLESDPVIQQVIDRQKLTDEDDKPLKPLDFKRKLNTSVVGGTDVVEVSYKSDDPQLASKIVNSLMDVYIQTQIEGNQLEPAAAREFLDKELPIIETQVRDAESQISSFRTKNNIVDLKEEKRDLVTGLGELNRQISTTGSELQGLKAQSAALQNQLGLNLDQAVTVNQLGGSPEVQSILEQLAQTESQLAQERQRFNDEHPAIASLLEKKNNLERQLRDLIATNVGEGVNVSEGLLQNNNGNIENQVEKFISMKIEELSLQRQVASLYESQQQYLKRAKELPSLEKRERQLVRAAESAGRTYETLLNSLQEAQIAENQSSGNADIVEYAAVPEEGSSGAIALMGMGLIMGIFLANISVILLEMQDRSLKSLADIKKKFPYHIVGIIPLESPKYKDTIVTRDEPDSFSSEIYRMIQANLKFLSSDKPPKVILVTSSVPEEGKSTVSANLAAAVAQLGRNVLLIDGDLRRSSQHYLWGVDNHTGLKEVIAGDRSPISVVKHPMEKLTLLTSGKVESNPLALLDSAEMLDLIGRSRREYDLILIDAPPLPVTADVLTLSKLADGIIFVTRPGIVEHDSAESAREAIETTRQKVLGMVVNGVEADDFKRYSYHGRYGASYFKSDNIEKQSNSTNSKNKVVQNNSSNSNVSKAKL